MDLCNAWRTMSALKLHSCSPHGLFGEDSLPVLLLEHDGPWTAFCACSFAEAMLVRALLRGWSTALRSAV